MGELQAELNRLAGTTGLDAQGAANVLAGTTELDLVGALNVRAGNTERRELAGVLNQLAGTTGRGVNAAATSVFNPFDTALYPTPLHAVWASDLASIVADGGAVSSWRNRSGGGDPAQATAANKPLYRASVAALGNRPAVEFDGTNDALAFDVANVSQTFKVVAVGALSSLDSVGRSIIGFGAGAERVAVSPANQWALNAGASIVAVSPAANTAAHVFVATCAGASSALTVDGAAAASGDAGANGLLNFTVGAAALGTTLFWKGPIGYAAIYAGATTDASLTTLARALGAYYRFAVA